MANEEFESDIPKIVLEKEDREAFQRSRQQNRSSEATTSETKDVKARTSGVSSAWLFLLFLMIVALGGGGYWLYQQTLVQSEQLVSAQKRIQDLERRLSATGEEMDQSAVALQVKVSELAEKTSELWGQMDKLWASAWRRNQSEIEALEKDAKAQNTKFDQQVSALDKELAQVEGEISLAATNFAVLQEQLNSEQGKTQAISEQMTRAMTQTQNDIKRQFGDIQSKLIAIDQLNSSLTRRIAELEKRQRAAGGTATP